MKEITTIHSTYTTIYIIDNNIPTGDYDVVYFNGRLCHPVRGIL